MQDVVAHLTEADRDSVIARDLLFPYLNHAATMFESGYATRDDIDASMRFGCGYPVGPLSMIDNLGASVVVAGLDDLYSRSGDPLHQPVNGLKQKAANGSLFHSSSDGDDAAADSAELKRDVVHVGVVGTGTMASGIVEVFAKAGLAVTFVGRSEHKVAGVVSQIEKSLDKAIARGKLDEAAKSKALGLITGATDRESLGEVDLVVEAIAEDLEVKRELFKDLDRICKPGAILATTTSSLPVAECASVTSRTSDVVGMHFFNPATVMKLVEVVSAEDTSADVSETVRALCSQVGKHPVSCGDRAGFIVNALLFPYLNDAAKAVDAGVGTMQEVDDTMKKCNLPMGPFELLDVVGNDVSLAIQQTLVNTFGHPGWQPAESLERAVVDGNLGRKTGKGFHDYAK